jgi:hypothetical protein
MMAESKLHRAGLRLGRVWWRASGETIEVFIAGMDPGVWIEVPLATFHDAKWVNADGDDFDGVDLRRSPWSDARESTSGLHVHGRVNLNAERFEEVVIRGPFEIPPPLDPMAAGNDGLGER